MVRISIAYMSVLMKNIFIYEIDFFRLNLYQRVKFTQKVVIKLKIDNLKQNNSVNPTKFINENKKYSIKFDEFC